MFEKILVAIDFSDHTQKVLECITGIPGIREIVLFHVFDATRPSLHGWTYGPAIENARILVDEKKKFLESRGYKVDTRFEVLTGGDIFQEILRCADATGVSVIVTGARGKSILNDILLGSVSQNILRHAKTSVLVYHDAMIEDLSTPVCGKSCPPLFSSVLIPTDFSGHSGKVIALAKELPGLGTVTLMNVVDHGETGHEIEESERNAQENLDTIAQDFITAGIAVKTQIRVGERAEMILSAAESGDASVIIMSPHGTGGFMELYIGSTTFEVMKRAKRPVLVVRTNS
jgi:nucleotide-binding universal stress UspA family protein